MRLRQVVLIARDLDRVVDDLTALLGIEVSFRDPGVEFFGLRNAVMPVGDTFLEVVSPLRADAAAARYLDRRGDGGYMVMLQSDEYEADRHHIEDLGIRIVWSTELDDIKGMHLHPRDTGGAILSLDQPTPPAAWRWAGPDWPDKIRRRCCTEIVSVELQADEPQTLSLRWSQVLQRPMMPTGEGSAMIRLERGSIHFVRATDGRSEGVGGFGVAVHDRGALLERGRMLGAIERGECLQLHGIRIYLEAIRTDA